MALQTPPSPEHIFDEIAGLQRSAALRAATELDLFTAIGEGADTAATLANRCGAAERGVRILSDYLVTLGLLSKQGTRYGLAPESAAFLDRRSPMYLGSVTRIMAGPEQWQAFQDLSGAVRKGGTVVSEEGILVPENPVWVEFARSAGVMMTLPANLIANQLAEAGLAPSKVLDIAAGHGLFGITLAQRNPQTQIVAVDWANVLEVARENAAKAGIEGRYHTIPGSAFDVDFGTGYDLVLLTNFLHHFDEETCTNFLRKVHGALRSDGWALALEFVPNEDRVSPPSAARFALIMLGQTKGGDAYTFVEFQRMFRAAGFQRCEIRSLEPSPERMILAQR